MPLDQLETLGEPPLYTRLAAAYVRGKLGRFLEPALDTLNEKALDEIIRFGRAEGLRLHRFKRTMGLPRVSKVLGILRGLGPASLLDIGSGRGAFLWPLLGAVGPQRGGQQP
jgi:hypothetical protein